MVHLAYSIVRFIKAMSMNRLDTRYGPSATAMNRYFQKHSDKNSIFEKQIHRFPEK
jgi:hypothetical protein